MVAGIAAYMIHGLLKRQSEEDDAEGKSPQPSPPI